MGLAWWVVGQIAPLTEARRVGEDAVLKCLRQYEGEEQLLYSEIAAYAFWSQARTMPQWTDLPMKFYWSGGVTPEVILDVLQVRNPDLLVLKTGKEQSTSWQSWLETAYKLKLQDPLADVYVRKQTSG